MCITVWAPSREGALEKGEQNVQCDNSSRQGAPGKVDVL